jgi:hypothetical protein
MKLDFTSLTKKLIALDKKGEQLDEALKDVRVAVNDVLWDLVELKNSKDTKS